MGKIFAEMGKQVIKEGAGLIRDPEDKTQEVELGQRPQGIHKSTLTIIVTLAILVTAFIIAVIITLAPIARVAQRMKLLSGWGHFLVLFAAMYVPIIGAVVFGTSVKYRNQKKDL